MKVVSLDPLQKGYTYFVNILGQPWREDFSPDFTPYQALTMGVFGGGYFAGHNNLVSEFPHLHVFQTDHPSADNNYYGVEASMSRREWIKRGWIHEDDPRGWFQWYCRYHFGRRHSDDDRQINRWKAFKKRKLIEIGSSTDPDYMRKTRQGLLHWAIASPGWGVTRNGST